MPPKTPDRVTIRKLQDHVVLLKRAIDKAQSLYDNAYQVGYYLGKMDYSSANLFREQSKCIINEMKLAKSNNRKRRERSLG